MMSKFQKFSIIQILNSKKKFENSFRQQKLVRFIFKFQPSFLLSFHFRLAIFSPTFSFRFHNFSSNDSYEFFWKQFNRLISYFFQNPRYCFINKFISRLLVFLSIIFFFRFALKKQVLLFKFYLRDDTFNFFACFAVKNRRQEKFEFIVLVVMFSKTLEKMPEKTFCLKSYFLLRYSFNFSVKVNFDELEIFYGWSGFLWFFLWFLSDFYVHVEENKHVKII